MNNLTASLNPQQKQAVECMDGPLLILAGAGSGKTRVLTHRMAQLILEKKAQPHEILCVTFTNKAAREMEARISALLSENQVAVLDPLWVSTFHSTCVRILRDHIHLLEYQPFFVIYDSSDQLSLIKKVLQQLNINDKVFNPKSFQHSINEAKTQALAPEDVEKAQFFVMDDMHLQVYKTYEEQMKQANALDFSDLLFKTYTLFLNYPGLLEEYQNQFKYIMVDEYQDTNKIQYLLLKQLASKHKNLCVVGDEDQSIYSWRGADISNILSFEKDFSNAEVIKLEQNYRSSKNIVEAAGYVIQHNTQRKNKTLYTDNKAGDLITVREETNEYEESRFIARTISDQVAKSLYQYQDFAIFYRTNAQSRVIEEELRSHNIPYRIVAGVKFYERQEIKNVISYLKILLNPNDDVALKRIINVPTRGIGKTTVERLEAYAIENQVPLYEAVAAALKQKIVHAGAQSKLRVFYQMIESLKQEVNSISPSELYLNILDSTEYALKLKADNTPESLARIENLEELHNALTHFEQEREDEATLQNFLEEIALVSDIDNMDDQAQAVTLMTLHISKGLEFPVVFIAGMEEGIFPTGRAFESSDPTALEEERRLAYVGMTRAMEKLYLLHAQTRRIWGNEQRNSKSRFITEIPESYLDESSSFKRPKFMNRFQSTPTFHDEDEVQYFPDEMEESSLYKKGGMVRHPTFGVGKIHQVEGLGEMQKVSVLFNNNTLKKFVVKYARLEVI